MLDIRFIRENLDLVKQAVKNRNLKLDLDKTSMYSIEKGFDFLGLNFREFPDSNRVKGTKKVYF